MKYSDILAGKAKFTISNGADHYTYQVNQIKDYNRYIVRVLTGPDNSKDFTYLGMLWSREAKSVSLTKKSSFTADSLPYKVFVFAQGILAGKIKMPKGYSIMHSGYCLRCGRELTTPESIKSGYGPTCRGYQH